MEDEQEFKQGDVVQLKSGGPVMTVFGVADANSGTVKCTWFPFDRSKGYDLKPQITGFPVHCLIPVAYDSSGKYFVEEAVEHHLAYRT